MITLGQNIWIYVAMYIHRCAVSMFDENIGGEGGDSRQLALLNFDSINR